VIETVLQIAFVVFVFGFWYCVYRPIRFVLAGGLKFTRPAVAVAFAGSGTPLDISKTKRGLLQVAKAMLALLTVLWAFSMAQVVARVLTKPGFFTTSWLSVLAAVGATSLPAWGHLKLTELLKRPHHAPSGEAHT